ICDEAGRKNEGATNRLYRNEGVDPKTGAPRFTDVTAAAGVGDKGYGMGAATADFDNDGHADLYVTNYGPNVLYRNNGDGTFSDVTAKAGVAGPEKVNGWIKWSTNSVFFDYDRDGRLDLFVCNYLAFDPAFNAYYGPENFPGPLNYLGQASILYRNLGDGTFEDVTEKAGVNRKDGRGMGASAADLNRDGWPDLYEANDAMVNYFWVNQGDGTFRDMAEEALLARGQGGENTSAMHASYADIDRDGWLDLFIPDTEYMALFRNLTGENKGVPLFEDITVNAGIARMCGQHDAWGGLFFDYDHDGWPDLFLSTGGSHRPEGQPALVLRNRGDRTFEDVSLSLNKRAFFERRLSRGSTVGDLDNDGDLDVVRVNIDVVAGGKEGLPTLFLNDGGNRAGHWLTVKLVGTRSNRDGIGAKVWVTAAGRVLVDEVRTVPGYLSSTDARVHFGLGAAEKAEKVEVEWPSGIRQTIADVALDQFLTVTEKGE
ncbi:MAG: CRTAC1 family protein, partial [Planctomycetes bacterium]|nr:CRTAC1 family protein [Planctomycetota bacterium]